MSSRGLVDVTRKYAFSASHRLHVDSYSDSENNEVFGKCNNPYGHGHNYEIYVTVRGPVDAESGFAVDIGKLDRLVGERVLSAFHLKNMNSDVAVFKTQVPTTENLALVIGGMIREGWKQEFLEEWPVFEKLRIKETERNIFEITNEKT